MRKRIPHVETAIAVVVLAVLSACATDQPSVIERMDELTAVTVTNSRTPIIMSPDTPYEGGAARDYLQIGAIEVNRMGTLKYYLWLGISSLEHMTSADKRPQDFELIVLVAGSEEVQLDVTGWTPEAIGVSGPLYKKLFRNSIDAYYEVTLDHIRLLVEVESVKLRTTGSEPTEFVSWYKQSTAKNDLSEFLRTVLQ